MFYLDQFFVRHHSQISLFRQIFPLNICLYICLLTINEFPTGLPIWSSLTFLYPNSIKVIYVLIDST